jgi:hypothetical protein
MKSAVKNAPPLQEARGFFIQWRGKDLPWANLSEVGLLMD